MSTTEVPPKCQICQTKNAVRKLSILVCEDHHDEGRPAMYRMLQRLRNAYQEEQEQDPTPIEPQVVIEPQPQAPPPQDATPAVRTVDQVIHELVNKARVAEGLKPYSYDEKLEAVALLHSKDMLKYDYFSHTGRDGSSHSDRFRRAGYTGCRNTGENIAWFSTSRLSSMSVQTRGEKIFNQWWTSPGHHKAMMSSTYTIEGIGIAIEGNKLMATQNFCRK